MKRKEFLSKGMCACIGAGIVFGGGQVCAASVLKTENEGTPCDKKHEFAQVYVKRLMNLLEEKLDETNRIDFVQSMGKKCAQGAYGKAETSGDKIPVMEFAKKLNARVEGNSIFWEYIQNPDGLKVTDGWCLCPLVEKGPEGLSTLYCECSVGYVKYMFERYTTSQVRVELLESLKRGGKGCKFKITAI